MGKAPTRIAKELGIAPSTLTRLLKSETPTADRRPEAGGAVGAQVYDWRRAAAETVMRLYEPPYLVAASLDEGLRRPLVVDNEQVIIKGVVLPHRLRPGEPST